MHKIFYFKDYTIKIRINYLWIMWWLAMTCFAKLRWRVVIQCFVVWRRVHKYDHKQIFFQRWCHIISNEFWSMMSLYCDHPPPSMPPRRITPHVKNSSIKLIRRTLRHFAKTSRRRRAVLSVNDERFDRSAISHLAGSESSTTHHADRRGISAISHVFQRIRTKNYHVIVRRGNPSAFHVGQCGRSETKLR